jgi:RNA polymerase sigma-70 factor (ECF subfamily)
MVRGLATSVPLNDADGTPGVTVIQRDLVERAGRGDHAAFASLVGASVAHLEAVARLILRDHDLARDAVQEAYIRAWRRLPGLREPERFDAWLHRLTVNACLDAVRRRHHRAIEVDIELLDMRAAGDALDRVGQRDQLERGFVHLTVDQRAVLVLHYYVGLSVPALAGTLGIPIGTAQSRLGRALLTLRSVLGTDDEPSADIIRRGQIA